MWRTTNGSDFLRADSVFGRQFGPSANFPSQEDDGSEEAPAAGVGRKNQYCATTFAFTKCGLRIRELMLRFSQQERRKHPKDCKRHFISPLVVSRSEN